MERIRLPLTGVQRAVNRNALEGATQQNPRDVTGFDLDRQGGYLATWKRSSSGILTLSETVRAYSPDGSALLSNSHVLLNEEEHDMSGGSISGLEQFLVPRAGILARPRVLGEDSYDTGAFFRDVFGNVGDLNRVASLSFTEGAAGGNVVADTYRFLALFMAPTSAGLVTYQALTEEHTVSSDVDSLTVTVDTVIPHGYRMRMYWWKTSYDPADEPSFFDMGVGTDASLSLGGMVSDGTNMTVELTDTRDSEWVSPSDDALAVFGGVRVEAHQERIWGVGTSTSFVGPFSAGLSPERYFKWTAEDTGHAIDTPNSATLNAINAQTTTLVSFNGGVQWSTGSGEATNRDDFTTNYSTGSGAVKAVVAPSSGKLWVLRDDRLIEFDTDHETELGAHALTAPTGSFTNTPSARSFAMDGSDNFYVLWASYVTSGGSTLNEWGVEKLNSSLTSQWVYHESESGSLGTNGHIVADSSGNSYFQKSPDRDDTFVVKLNTSGAKQWEQGSSIVSDAPVDIAINSAGSRIVSFDEHAVRMFTSAGSLVWSRDIESAYQSYANHMVDFDGDGNVLYSYTGSSTARVTKVDPSDGSTIEASPKLGDEAIVGVVQDSAGFYYAISRLNGEVRKFSFVGGVEWTLTGQGGAALHGVNLIDVNTISVARTDEVEGYLISDSWYFPFSKRGTQFEVGLKSLRNPEDDESVRFYAKVDDVELEVGNPIPNDNGNTTFSSLANFLSRSNVQFSIDLADGTSSAVTVTVRDSDDVTQYTRTSSVHSDWPSSFTSSTSELQVLGYYPGLAGLTGEVTHSAFYVEWYDDDSASTVEAKADAEDYSPGSNTFTSSSTGEQWTLDSVNGNVHGGLANLTTALPGRETIIYSETGHVNLASYFNYVHVDFQMSPNGVTALASTPAGLLVFGDNETMVFRGDPDGQDFAIQRAFGVFGCDVGVTPGRLGGIVFPIWNGRVYMISLGMGDVDFGSGIEDISDPVFDPQDPFVQVVGEPRSRQVIARTESGVVVRYSPQRQAWFTDVWSEADDLVRLLPYPDDKGTRYVVGSELHVAEEGASAPFATWEHLDLGDKVQRLLWRRAYMYTNDAYAGTPELEFDSGLASGTITGLEEGPGEFVFTFPKGTVAPKMTELKFTMNGASLGDSLEAPIEIEFQPRYRRR